MWYQLTIEHCPRAEADMASDELEESGAVSVTLTDRNDDAILEPELGTMPLWPEVVVTALYTDEELASLSRATLSTRHPNWTFRLEILEDQNWERAWMDNFKPQKFGKRLWVCPSWSTPPDPDAVNLILDPGLAFGTGTHPTTSLCLQWLDQADLQGKSLIDYGCGSGILALAALKLGADKVFAVDIDPQALQATQNNALANGINDQHLNIDYPSNLKGNADIMVANILLTPLIALRDSFSGLIKENGLLVCSGILREQADSLIAAYEGCFALQTRMDQDDWSLLVFTRTVS
ncbi:50S ribosomal protein L11 methyltransferase [Legionella sp. CNM-4043-24]|uniref:50S ribosomal protein L11 methyltransferase n=1 Tax=Legionella sp. CNM-4043-24 TaxID=3421646 RepID=UPI00403A98BF